GRPPGMQNLFTRQIKEAAVNAATRYGADGTGLGGLEGFFFRCCDLYGQTMIALLGRICPLQKDADGERKATVYNSGLGEAPLFLHRQLRQGVDLCALVERGADDLPQHDDLGASGLAGDSAAALAGLLGGVVDEGVGLLSLILRLSTLGLGCFGPASSGAALRRWV